MTGDAVLHPQRETKAATDPWGSTRPVLTLERDHDEWLMVLVGVPELATTAAAIGLPVVGRGRWRVTGWHRRRALWPFADPDANAFLSGKMKEHHKPARPPSAPFLTMDKYGFVFVCGHATSGPARRAGLQWDRDRSVWRTAQRYLARHLWALADDFADEALVAEFGARAKPPCPLGRPTLFFDEGRFIYTCDFKGKDAAKGAGLRWDPDDKIWYTRQIPLALRLHADAEPRLREVLARSREAPPFASLAKLSLLDFVEVMLPEEEDRAPSRMAGGAPELLHVLPDGRFYCTDNPKAFNAGFKPDDRGMWVTSDVERALLLRDCADLFAERAIQERLSADFAARVAVACAVKPPPIPAPEGLHYMPYQVEGICFAAARKNTLLGDEMGLGKTVQALGLINLTRPHRTLIACPAMLCPNWLREARRWLTYGISAYVLRTPLASDSPTAMFPVDSECTVAIASYDILHRLPSGEWDLAVFDEAHYLKNPSARRTRAALETDGIKAARRLFMTGTPIFNRPQDLWSILSTSLSSIFHRQARFKDLYAVADPRSIPEEKAENLTVLGGMLAKTIMLRRLKKDVLHDLPEKSWQTVLMDVGDETARMLAKGEWEAKGRLDAAVAAHASMKERSSILAEIATLRRRTAEAKLPAALEHIRTVVEQDEPIVVFAYHRDIAQSLATALTNEGVRAVMIDGSVPAARRQTLVDAFQTGHGDVLVATMDAAGVGLTMTRSATIAFVELDWTPAKMRQAEDRVHRHGQRRCVTVQYLVVDGTIDAYIAELAQSKTDMAASTLGDDLLDVERLLSGAVAPR
jgi:SWI/SNF-related matrix-associated actin-dependent regulator 1 of chromatin subfamily A